MANERFGAPEPPREQPAVAESAAPGGDVGGRAMAEPQPPYGTGQSTMPDQLQPDRPGGSGWEMPEASSNGGGSMMMRAVPIAAGVAAAGAGLAWLMQRRRQRHSQPRGWERVQQSAMHSVESLTEAAREAAHLARERATDR